MYKTRRQYQKNPLIENHADTGYREEPLTNHPQNKNAD